MPRCSYGAGLRLLECASLRVKDLDSGSGAATFARKGVERSRNMLPRVLNCDACKRTSAQSISSIRETLCRSAERGPSSTRLRVNVSQCPARMVWQWVFPAHAPNYLHLATKESLPCC